MSLPEPTVTTAAVEACLRRSQLPWWSVAAGEWGLRAEAAGWPLHVGLRVRDGLLAAQAEVLGPGLADPHDLLHRGRRLTLVRFTHTRAGAVWIQGEIPVAATAGPGDVDRLLATLVLAADDLRAAHPGAGA